MSFFDKLKEGASKAADKAKDTVEITRLGTQISSKRKEIEKCFNQMGEAVFQAYVAKDLSSAEAEIERCSNNVIVLQQEIAVLEHRIKVVKNEKDCTCGNVVALDSKFCPKCGHHFEIEEEAEPEALATSVKPCPSCGAEMDQSDKFCGSCGASAQ